MTEQDRIFELEKTLEVILDLFDDMPDGKVYINVEVEDSDGIVESVCRVPQPDADSVAAAIKLLYSEEDSDEA